MSVGRISKSELVELFDQSVTTWDELVAAVGDRYDQPGPMGDWTFKDLVQHLNGWRIRTVDRLEATTRDVDPPPFPWPGALDPDDVDAINDWFQEQGRQRTYDELLAEARDQFARVRTAVASIPEEVLNDPDRFPWIANYALADVVAGSIEHLLDEHAPDVRRWLARTA